MLNVRAIAGAVAVYMLSVTLGAAAATNAPVLYPRDNSLRYAYGYSGIDYPVVYVQRGHVTNIMLEPGEMLPPTEANGVLLDDRVRWVSVASRSGGQRLSNGQRVPTTWMVAVEPAGDAEDAWLTIHTELGRHYMLHLVPVARNDSRGERLVGFYYWHTPPRMNPRVLRQAVARNEARRLRAIPAYDGTTP